MQHEIIAFARAAPVYAAATPDIKADHADAVRRLVAELRPVEEAELRPPAELSAAAVALLGIGIKEPANFKAALRADVNGATQLRAFLRSPLVPESALWPQHFSSAPPRGVVARLAWKANVELHPSVAFYNYESVADFRREVKRIRRWYKRSRKASRRRMGIVRSLRQAARVRGTKVWTRKLKAHFKRLLKPLRIEGLWAVRSVSLALRRAGVPVRTGTVAVEAYWAILKGMLPGGSRKVSLRWFRVLAQISFLRYNYSVFNDKHSLPTWAERDPLLTQEMDAFVALLNVSSVTNADHLQPLFDPFLP
jgi:hypothetical protein